MRVPFPAASTIAASGPLGRRAWSSRASSIARAPNRGRGVARATHRARARLPARDGRIRADRRERRRSAAPDRRRRCARPASSCTPRRRRRGPSAPSARACPTCVVVDTRLGRRRRLRVRRRAARRPRRRARPRSCSSPAPTAGVSHRAEARRRFAPADYLPTPLDLARAGAAGGRAGGARRAPTAAAARSTSPNRDRRRRARPEGEPARSGPAARAPRRRAERQVAWPPMPTTPSCRAR